MDLLITICMWALAALIGLCAVIGASSQLLVWAKQATGLPKPGDSPRKQKWFCFLHYWDIASRNSPMIACQLQTLQHRLQLLDQKKEISQLRTVVASQENERAELLAALKKEAP